jgi:hypothetical protein
MSFSFDAPEDIAGEGAFLSEPGTYHFVVTAIREGEGGSGTPIDGFTIEADCLGGTVAECAGKNHRESLFAPDLSKTEKNQLASRRKLAAFFIATDLMKPEQLGKPVQIDLQAAVGRQFIMRLARQMEKDDKGKFTIATKYLQLDYAAIFHVDDPEVKGIPKNADALGMIDKSLRHDEEYFAFKAKRRPAQQPHADNFDDF